MRPRPTLSSFAFVGCALLAAATPTPTGDPAAFEAALTQTRSLISTEKCKAARACIDKALADHQGAQYVRDHLADVEEVLRHCASGLNCPRKEAKEVLCGGVQSYDRKSGAIDVVYKKDKAAAKSKNAVLGFPCDDFETKISTTESKLPFVGPYSFELRGSALGQTPPKIHAAITDAQHYEIKFDAGATSKIELIVGEGKPQVLAMANDIFNVARPYVLKVAVRATTLDASVNGKGILSAPKEETQFGRFGYCDLGGLEEIRVSGTVDPAWIEARVDAQTKACREKFEEGYDVKRDLPDWLR